MIGPEQTQPRISHKKSHRYSAWTLAALCAVALGIVFALAETGTAAVGQADRYNSPPPSPVNSPLPPPIVENISPSTGVVGSPHQINVYGDHFQDNAVVQVAKESEGRSVSKADTSGLVQLNTTFISGQHLLAKVPADIPTGLYGVKVINPDAQQSSTLHSAYAAASADPQQTDDLNARPENLWATPHTLIIGESASLVLNVFRVGGVGGLPPFVVDFYAGEIAPEHFIGRGVVPGISPNDSAFTSAVAWTPAAYGEISLFAVIDPDGQIGESNEGTIPSGAK